MKTDSEYDKKYDIRLASIDDIPYIMKFLDDHWKKGHIMATNRKLFEYEYVHEDEVDFILAIDKNTKKIEALFGFLRCSKDRNGDIWGSMWMVNDNPDNMKLLGVELAKRVYSLTGCRSHIGNGANPKTTIPLRKIFFREKTVKMKQYYRLNADIENYEIAVVKEPWISEKLKDTPVYHLKKIESFKELLNSFDIDSVNGIPHKDSWYVNHRYFEHPVYHYDIYGIQDQKKICRAIFVTRSVVIGKSGVLRIVDYIGDHKMFAGLYDEIGNLISSGNYEYIDFFEYGISDELIEKAGFKNRDEFNNIIPNYFEPFVQENIDIWAHYKEDGTTFFKADGDQDRPNIV